jgi:hypothetical protein
MMTWLRRLWSQESRMRERADEMRAHVDLYAEDLIARGVPPEEARRQARITFGNPRVKLEEVDALNRVAWLDALRRDVRHASRSLAARPGFSIIVLAGRQNISPRRRLPSPLRASSRGFCGPRSNQPRQR